MANSEVLLLQPIENLGAEGDVVTVRAGYARNYLLPRKRALPITQANKKYVESLMKVREERQQKEFQVAQALSEKIKKIHIAIAVKTGEGGKMFGSVTAANLIERLSEEEIEITKKQLSLSGAIKELGSHIARIKLHPEVEVELKFEVVSENPIDEAPVEEPAANDES